MLLFVNNFLVVHGFLLNIHNGRGGRGEVVKLLILLLEDELNKERGELVLCWYHCNVVLIYTHVYKSLSVCRCELIIYSEINAHSCSSWVCLTMSIVRWWCVEEHHGRGNLRCNEDSVFSVLFVYFHKADIIANKSI